MTRITLQAFCYARSHSQEKCLSASSCPPVCLSVRPGCINAALTGRIFWLKTYKNTRSFIWRPKYVFLLTETYIRHGSILVQYPIFWYCWQCSVAQQYTPNALLSFNDNNSYATAPHCCIIRTVHCLSCFHFIPRWNRAQGNKRICRSTEASAWLRRVTSCSTLLSICVSGWPCVITGAWDLLRFCPHVLSIVACVNLSAFLFMQYRPFFFQLS